MFILEQRLCFSISGIIISSDNFYCNWIMISPLFSLASFAQRSTCNESYATFFTYMWGITTTILTIWHILWKKENDTMERERERERERENRWRDAEDMLQNNSVKHIKFHFVSISFMCDSLKSTLIKSTHSFARNNNI